MRVKLESASRARGSEASVHRLLEHSLVPMTLVDGERRHVDANAAARLAVQLPLEQLRQMRIDDLTPRYLIPVLEEEWHRLRTTGRVFGESYELVSPSGSRMDATYFALCNALPGLSLIAFAPVTWPEDELLRRKDLQGDGMRLRLTTREAEVLQLAADGNPVKGIAAQLVVSPATVRTHFANIYGKLGVSDRAAAVAKALRLGAID